MNLSPFIRRISVRVLASLTAALVLVPSFILAQQPPAPPPAPLAVEMEKRLKLANEAQASGNPVAITEASKRVVSLALRQFANLRFSEGALSAAAELASESLAIEDNLDTRFLMATALSRADRNDEALAEVKIIVAREPNSAEAWDLLGRIALAKNDYRGAVEALSKANAMKPDIERTYTLAVALLQVKELDQAAALFKKLVDTGGDPARMHIMAGRAYEGVSFPDKAEAEYRAAIAANPKTSRGHYFLGLLILTRNAWEVTPAAKQELLAEVAVNPDDFFGNYFMGCILSGEKKYEESDRYLKIALAAKPDFPEPFLYLGLNAYGEQRFPVAEEYLRKAIKLTGKDLSRNHYQVRRAYFTLGRILTLDPARKEESLEMFKRSKEMENTLLSEARGQMLDLRDATAGAPVFFGHLPNPQPAVSPVGAAAPLSTEAWTALKMSAEEKLKAQAGEVQLRKLLASSYNDLGTTSARMREFPLAASYFRDAERWDPLVPGMMRNLGMAAFLSSNYSECIRAMTAASQQQPLDPTAQSMLALSFYSTNKYAEAVKAFDPIKDGVFADPRMAYSYAVSLARTGEKTQASGILEKLMGMNQPAGVQVRIGQLYAEMGDRAAAESCYDRARKQDPTVNIPK